MKLFRVFILLFLSVRLIFGQDMQFVSFTTKDNLSQSTVYKIVQDKQGFIWIGTDDGLNKFDGKNFKIYKNIPNNINSLSSNKINDLYVDKDGNIWIATDRGFNLYNVSTQKFTRFFFKTKYNENDLNNYNKICFDSLRNGFWLATNKSGFVFFNPQDTSFKEYHFETTPSFQKFHATNFLYHGNILWITSDGGGLFKFNTLTKQINQYQLPVNKNEDSTKINFFNTLLYNPFKDNYIIGTQNSGIYIFDPQNKHGIFKKIIYNKTTLENTEQDRVKDFVQQDDKLWIATYGGLVSFNLKTEQLGKFYYSDKKPNSLTSNRLSCLFLDNNQNLWIGSIDQGINVFFPTRFKFPLLYSNDASNQYPILAIYKINAQYTIFSVDGEGLLLWQTKTKKVIKLNTLPNYSSLHPAILSITMDKDSMIWLGTWGGGLQKLDFKHKKVTTFFKQVSPTGIRTILSICPGTEKDILWLGTFSGLVKFNKTTQDYTFYNQANGFASDKIFTITCNNSDTLWIGTMDGGFSIFNKRTEKATTFLNNINNPKSLSSNMVYSILNQTKILWLATSNGLNIFDKKTQTFKAFFSNDGLPNDNLYAVLPEGDSVLWISSNKGLSKVTLDENKLPKTFTNFDSNDGLQSNEFNQGAFFKSIIITFSAIKWVAFYLAQQPFVAR
ncbi:MAG TPA: hypothetical protein EYP69_04950 [Bacteroidales bacterium]|nr:hypothetical protein [Bacteroidales bacterium]